MALPDFKLRLFASADVIGSTAFKTRDSGSTDGPPTWPETFRYFFSDFPTMVESNYPDNFSEEKLDTWKFVGDEILFQAGIHNHQDVAIHLMAFRKALIDFPKEWAQTNDLGLKGACWTAGFPVGNREVPVTDDTHDFIGPSMDLGFRISKFATSRKFVVSAEIALMLADCRAYEELKLQLDARHTLKGIHGGRPYPVFWIDNVDEEANLIEKIVGLKRESDLAVIREYTDHLFGQQGRLERPFIESDPDPKYCTIPKRFIDHREALFAIERDYDSAPAPTSTTTTPNLESPRQADQQGRSSNPNE